MRWVENKAADGGRRHGKKVAGYPPVPSSRRRHLEVIATKGGICQDCGREQKGAENENSLGKPGTAGKGRDTPIICPVSPFGLSGM
jgi:hypothetical protein